MGTAPVNLMGCLGKEKGDRFPEILTQDLFPGRVLIGLGY
jgi:hypothetical protein